jgi:hypothetical protein
VHSIIREKFAILLRELRCECFVVRDDERRLIDSRNDICGRKRFTRAGNTKKRLEAHAFFDAFNKALYSLRLVAGWSKFGRKREFHIATISSF